LPLPTRKNVEYQAFAVTHNMKDRIIKGSGVTHSQKRELLRVLSLFML